MPTISRLTGRFFSAYLPIILAALLLPVAAIGQAPTLCQITDTVYRADGTPAQGTALISWPAFTTAAGQAVTPGSLTVTLSSSGGFSASLAPNTGASPAGTYYRTIFKLDDGTTDSEYWVVPNAPTTTIGAIRSKLVPSSQAAQFLTRDYADSTYVSLASSQTITGVKTFSNSPAVPTPQHPTDAANKAYVDSTGGGGGNLASPPPIGNVTPNTGNFTTLTAQNINGVANPGNFPQPDPCAQINAAIAALPAAGGTIDARSFAPGQACATTITANKPVKILFGAGTWTLGGNPGIDIETGKVTIECPAGGEGDLYNTFPATLKSGGAYPLISDTVQGLHNSDGTTIRNCYLDGNGIGTFGLFFPYGNSGHLENVYTGNFASVGQFILGGQWTSWAASSGGNGGDGAVWGFDGSINGNSQFAGNQGTALHLVSGGNDLNGVGTYKNRLHGIYIDGTGGGDWTVSTTYIQQSFIRPTTGNPGNFVYFTQAAGTTSAGRPSFCQTPGCTFPDGTVTWINAGTAYGYTSGVSIFNDNYWNFIKSANCSSNGYQAPAGFDADDIRIEGTASAYAVQNSILSAKVRQSESNDSPAHGIHLKWASTTTIDDVQWLGAGFSGNVDLGGLRIENSFDTNVEGIDCYNSYSNCVQVAGSSQKVVLGNLVAENDAWRAPRPRRRLRLAWTPAPARSWSRTCTLRTSAAPVIPEEFPMRALTWWSRTSAITISPVISIRAAIPTSLRPARERCSTTFPAERDTSGTSTGLPRSDSAAAVLHGSREATASA